MTREFIEFLKNLEDAPMRAASDDEIKKLRELSDGRLPDDYIDALSKSVLENEVEYGDFVFYGVSRMYDENIDYVPGANIFPFGLLTFASTFDGDAICIDLNDPALPVYQCSHELLCDETEISYFKNGATKTMDFNYENIIKISPRLADSFSDFVGKLTDDSAETYGVIDMINMM